MAKRPPWPQERAALLEGVPTRPPCEAALPVRLPMAARTEDDRALAGMLGACFLVGLAAWGLCIYALWHLLT